MNAAELNIYIQKNITQNIKNLKIKLSIGRRVFNTLLSLVFIILSVIVLLYASDKKDVPFSTELGSREQLIIGAVGFLIGVYIFYDNLQFAKLTPVYSDLNINSKAEIINRIAPLFKNTVPISGRLDKVLPDMFELYYCKSIWIGQTLKVTILTDEKGFYINTMDWLRYTPISFGIYRRMTKKVKKEIENKLNQHPTKE